MPQRVSLSKKATMTLTSEQLRSDFKYLFVDEVPALKSLVRSLSRRPLVINIGAGAGTSGLAILEARPDSILVTIDIQNESSPLGCLEAERDVIQRAGMKMKVVGRHWQFCMDSVEAGLHWYNEMRNGWQENHGIGFIFKQGADMVFIDGDHSYEHCRDDIQTWLCVLKDGGIIAVHDYQKHMFEHSPDGPHPKSWPGVDRAVDENLLNKYPLALHVDSLIAFRKSSL